MVGALVLSAQITLEASPPPPIPSDDDIIETLELSKHPASELELLSVTLDLFSDGSRRVNVEGEYGYDLPPATYTVAVNRETQTYLTVIVPTPVDPVDLPEDSASANIGAFQVSPGTYTATVIIRHRDFPNYTFTRTRNFLYWRVNSNGSSTWLNWADECTGYTTPINTHWYVLSCTNNPAYYAGAGTRSENYVQGKYYNSDWGQNNQNT